MQAWPVRGGRCRLAVQAGAAVLALILGACGGEESTPDGRPGAVAGTVAVAEPSFCAADTVVSEEAAGWGEEATAEELQALLLANPPENPEGYRSQTVIVDRGLGSFRITVPDSYSPVWRYGTPPDDLLELAEERDPAWTAFWGEMINGGEGQTRAISVDTRESDQVVALLITLTEAPDESGDALAASFAESYGTGGGLLGESCGVRANGAEGAYVEHTVPRSIVGGSVDRTQLQFLIPDPPNNALWGVTCDVPKAMASRVKSRCKDIASMFRPLPAVRS